MIVCLSAEFMFVYPLFVRKSIWSIQTAPQVMQRGVRDQSHTPASHGGTLAKAIVGRNPKAKPAS